MPPSDAGREALAHLDQALTKQPEKDGDALSAALRGLGTLRDGVVTSHRRRPTELSRTLLDHLNAVISSVLAAQYPLGEVPWEELNRARGWLRGLLDSGGLERLPTG